MFSLQFSRFPTTIIKRKRQHGREVTVEGRGGTGARVPPAATRAPAAPQSKRLVFTN